MYPTEMMRLFLAMTHPTLVERGLPSLHAVRSLAEEVGNVHEVCMFSHAEVSRTFGVQQKQVLIPPNVPYHIVQRPNWVLDDVDGLVVHTVQEELL